MLFVLKVGGDVEGEEQDVSIPLCFTAVCRRILKWWLIQISLILSSFTVLKGKVALQA